jgi:hypothetical protein
MAIPVSRHAMPYVATTINLVMAIVLGAIALLSVQLGSPTALAYGAALGFAANAIRMWRKFNLAASVMALAFLSVVVLFGIGVVAMRQLA